MLGRRAADGRPVALLPGSAGRYVLVDPADHTRIAVDSQRAGLLEPTAVVFYRTFSSDRPTLSGFVRFALPSIQRELWTLVVMGVVGGLLGLVVPIVTAITIDDAIPRADRRQLFLLCAFLVAVALAVASFQAIQTVALARLRGKLESSLLPAFWDRLLAMPTRFFAHYEAGDLALRALGPARLIDVLASTTVASMLASVFALFNVAALFRSELEARAARDRASGRVFRDRRRRPPTPLGLPAPDLDAPGRDRRLALPGAGRDRTSTRCRRGATRVCAVGDPLSPATRAQPTLPETIRQAGAPLRRVADRRSDGGSRLRGSGLGVPERR